MPSRRRRQTIDEQDAFLLKLIAFRKGLTPAEQGMLDAMAVAAFREPREDVRGYAQQAPADLQMTADGTASLAAYQRLLALHG